MGEHRTRHSSPANRIKMEAVEEDMEDPQAEVTLPDIMHSSFLDLESSNAATEEVMLGKDTVELPVELYANKQIFRQLFSPDTWDHHISRDLKAQLMSLLPNFPGDDLAEKAKTLDMLFGGANFRFGNPLEEFRRELVAGRHLPEKQQMRQLVGRARLRDRAVLDEERQVRVLQQLLTSRQRLLESNLKASVTLPVQKIEMKKFQVRGGMRARIRRRYLEELARIRREVGEDGVSSDDEELLRDLEKEEELISLAPDEGPEASQSPRNYRRKESSVDVESHSSQVEDFPFKTALTQDTHSSFFALLRELFFLGEIGRLTMPELDQLLAGWEESPIAALNSWYPLCVDPSGWRASVPSAIAFLCGSFPHQVPPGFSTVMSVDTRTGSYSWVGRQGEQELGYLCDWWLARRDSCKAGYFSQKPPDISPAVEASSDAGGVGEGMKSTSWQVRPSTLQEKLAYRQQETERYENPREPYVWSVHGYTACVGPVKGAGTVKAKPHSMLIAERPACVTILTLVRDAVSRLPNGEGTRTDVIELLKDSQYVREGVDTNSLTTTVSGALDRLQNEQDPCLRYDSVRKMWMYLHRNKRPEDFAEMLSQQNAPKRRAQKRIMVDSSSRDEEGESSSTLVQRVIVKGADGKIIPLSAATLQKLIDTGAIKPGTQVETPDFLDTDDYEDQN